MANASHHRERLLVDAEYVDSLIRGEGPQQYAILEVLYIDDEDENGEAHGEPPEPSPRSRRCIPGAVSVHPSYFEAGEDTSRYYPRYRCPEDGNLLPDDQLQDAIARLGITSETLVVVYGKGAIATMTACRALWALMYAGVRETRYLDGGFLEWQRYGGELANGPEVPVAAASFGASQCMTKFLATSEEVGCVAREEAPGYNVDVRKLGEYEGWLKDNYGFFATAGHIPACVYQGNWDELIDRETEKLRPTGDVEARWRLLGIQGERGVVIFYCGTGWRSSVSFVLGYLMGWESKNYDHGWYGWSCGLTGADCRVCATGCGCNIVRDDKGFTVRALKPEANTIREAPVGIPSVPCAGQDAAI